MATVKRIINTHVKRNAPAPKHISPCSIFVNKILPQTPDNTNKRRKKVSAVVG